MPYVIFALIVVMLIYVSYKNVTVLLRYKDNKKYIDSYKGVLDGASNGHDDITNYVNSVKSLEFKTKGSILKLYSELDNGLDYTESLNNIDLKNLYYKKGKLSISQYKMNCDSFIFIMMTMARAHNKKKNDVVSSLISKVNEIKGLENNIEFLEINALGAALLKENDLGNGFANMMLDGSYANLKYEKNLITLYKRIAACILAFNKNLKDEYFLNDMPKFAKTLIGHNLMEDMKLYDKYKPQEEGE